MFKCCDRLVCGRLSLLADDLSVRQVDGVSEPCGICGSCVEGTNGNEVGVGGGLNQKPLFQLLSCEPIPSEGEDPIRNGRRLDELGLTDHRAFGLARCHLLGSQINAHHALVPCRLRNRPEGGGHYPKHHKPADEPLVAPYGLRQARSLNPSVCG
jgi:hypothetical protein